MDYRIEKKNEFSLICKKRHVNKPQGDTATEDISRFWNECSQDGTMESLCKYGKFDQLKGVLGICFSKDMDSSGFPYGIGVEYNGLPIKGEGLEIIKVPAYTYAVFECRGKMPDSFKNTYQKICTDFFPQSNYEYGNGIELEVYPSSDVNDPNYYCEIWVAVNERK